MPRVHMDSRGAQLPIVDTVQPRAACRDTRAIATWRRCELTRDPRAVTCHNCPRTHAYRDALVLLENIGDRAEALERERWA